MNTNCSTIALCYHDTVKKLNKFRNNIKILNIVKCAVFKIQQYKIIINYGTTLYVDVSGDIAQKMPQKYGGLLWKNAF